MSDTPKHWKQYLEYVEQGNNARREAAEGRLLGDERLYDEMPWYMKLLKTRPSEKLWHSEYISFDREPTLLDYYDWDVNVRRKRGK